jgi:CheY-like chemotaxis protein
VRVLVVEDHAWNARLLRTLLVAEGFDARIAASGQEALAQAELFRPELVLMDLELPDLGGLAVTRLLKANAATRECVVVMLTAHAPEDIAAAAIEVGGAGILTKPIDTTTFAATLRGYLPK